MRRRAGMTLVEVMISVGILLTGLTAVFALLLTAAASARRAKHETDAAAIASSVLADLRGEFSHGNAPAGDAPGSFQTSPDNPEYQFNRAIVPLDPARKGAAPGGPAGKEFFVRVEVRWQQQGDNKSIKVDTIMFRKDR